MLAIGATHKHQIYRAALAQTRLRRLGSGTREPPADHWRPVCGRILTGSAPSTPHSAALISRMRITAALAPPSSPQSLASWLPQRLPRGRMRRPFAEGCPSALASETCGMHLGPAHCRREDGMVRCPRVDATRVHRGLSPPVAVALARGGGAPYRIFELARRGPDDCAIARQPL